MRLVLQATLSHDISAAESARFILIVDLKTLRNIACDVLRCGVNSQAHLWETPEKA